MDWVAEIGSELSFVFWPESCRSWVLSDRAAPGWRAPLRVIPGRTTTGPPFFTCAGHASPTQRYAIDGARGMFKPTQAETVAAAKGVG